MNKSCLNCKHCYHNQLCTLFDELIDGLGFCFMWNLRGGKE